MIKHFAPGGGQAEDVGLGGKEGDDALLVWLAVRIAGQADDRGRVYAHAGEEIFHPINVVAREAPAGLDVYKRQTLHRPDGKISFLKT